MNDGQVFSESGGTGGERGFGDREFVWGRGGVSSRGNSHDAAGMVAELPEGVLVEMW